MSDGDLNKLTRIGILGGGQLGRMLYEAALSLGIQDVVVYEKEASKMKGPAASAGAKVLSGDLFTFLRDRDVYLLENEFVDCDEIESTLKEIEEKTQHRVRGVLMESIRIAQNKWHQKNLWKKLGLPTAQYREIKTVQDVERCHFDWGGLVLKMSKMGYDGKGNFLLPPRLSQSAFKEQLKLANAFLENAQRKNILVFAEQWVPFEFECALVASRGEDATWGSYPLIQTEQKNGVCLFAFGPCQSATRVTSATLFEEAKKISKMIGQELKLVGTYAVEFFVTSQGLLINEIAPRVHNSGHFTLKASPINQFQNHIRAALNVSMDPPSFAAAPVFAMVNLLGPEKISSPILRPTCFKALPQNFQWYWYDKARTEPGRKLGHIVAVSESGQNGEDRCRILRKELAELEQTWKKTL